MYKQKAFVEIPALKDNSVAAISPVGELSPLARSFEKEKTHYTNVDYLGIEINVFSSIRYSGSSTNQTAEYVVPDPVSEARVIEIASWIHRQAQSGRYNQSADDFTTEFIDYWGAAVELLGTGRMVGKDIAWYPSWVEISVIDEVFEETQVYKLWFSDESFINEYDEYEISVVPPVANIDSLIDDFEVVQGIKSRFSMTEVMGRVASTRGDYPATTTTSSMFNWTNPHNQNQKIPFEWTTIIWGAAGESVDNIKEAIRNYIADNSEHPVEVWQEHFPEIYSSTEFIFTAMMNHYSIPNRRLETGLYSPTPTLHDQLEYAKLTCKGDSYTPDHIVRNATAFPTLYKQAFCTVVPGPNNRPSAKRFAQVFPDYINAKSTDVDSGRMTAKTREFVTAINSMIRFAEELTDVSSVPRGYNRTIREGVVYISKSIDNIQYLVVTKHSLNDPDVGIPDLLTDGDGWSLTDGESPLVGG